MQFDNSCTKEQKPLWFQVTQSCVLILVTSES